MGKIFNLGRPFFAITVAGFGVLYLVWARFGDAMFPSFRGFPRNRF